MSITQELSKIFTKFLQISVQEWNAYNFNFLHLMTFLMTLSSLFGHVTLWDCFIYQNEPYNTALVKNKPNSKVLRADNTKVW